jgi:predicted phosphodiesterase
VRGVYGNIDGPDVRSVFPEKLHFQCEQIKIFMTHIGGHPARYAPGIKKEIQETQPNLFVCGHSHILKIIYDDKLNCLHINPGAAGRQGWHNVRTVVRLVIEGNNMRDCEVVELGKR